MSLLVVATSVGRFPLFLRASRSLVINVSVALGSEVPGCEKDGSRLAPLLGLVKLASGGEAFEISGDMLPVLGRSLGVELFGADAEVPRFAVDAVVLSGGWD